MRKGIPPELLADAAYQRGSVPVVGRSFLRAIGIIRRHRQPPITMDGFAPETWGSAIPTAAFR